MSAIVTAHTRATTTLGALYGIMSSVARTHLAHARSTPRSASAPSQKQKSIVSAFYTHQLNVGAMRMLFKYTHALSLCVQSYTDRSDTRAAVDKNTHSAIYTIAHLTNMRALHYCKDLLFIRNHYPLEFTQLQHLTILSELHTITNRARRFCPRCVCVSITVRDCC